MNKPKHFLYHLAKANTEFKEVKRAKWELKQSVDKLKTYATRRKVRKETLEEHLDLIEQKLQEIIERERNIKYGQDERIGELKNEIIRLEIELAQSKASSKKVEELGSSMENINEK